METLFDGLSHVLRSIVKGDKTEGDRSIARSDKPISNANTDKNISFL